MLIPSSPKKTVVTFSDKLIKEHTWLCVPSGDGDEVCVWEKMVDPRPVLANSPTVCRWSHAHHDLEKGIDGIDFTAHRLRDTKATMAFIFDSQNNIYYKTLVCCF